MFLFSGRGVDIRDRCSAHKGRTQSLGAGARQSNAPSRSHFFVVNLFLVPTATPKRFHRCAANSAGTMRRYSETGAIIKLGDVCPKGGPNAESQTEL
jgi:hypothetical protein